MRDKRVAEEQRFRGESTRYQRNIYSRVSRRVGNEMRIVTRLVHGISPTYIPVSPLDATTLHHELALRALIDQGM